MKIILSPTKTMKRKDLSLEGSEIEFKSQSDELRNLLKAKTKDELKILYKASDKIVNTTYQYYFNDLELQTALSLYDGLVFKQLDLKSYHDEEHDYLSDHVRILSTMYGALKVTDLISEYRLDYLMKFDLNLYEFWEESLSEYFSSDDLIVNLASQEYVKSFKHDNILNIHFVNKEMKTQSTQAKMARGTMLDYMIKHKVKDREGILAFSELNYKYAEEHSDQENIYFILED